MRNLKNEKVTSLICRVDIITSQTLLSHLHLSSFTESCYIKEIYLFLCTEDHFWILGYLLISWNLHKLDVLLFTRISWSSSSSHSSGSFPHLSLVFWGNTHHQHSPWMKRFSINHQTPDLRSNQVISLCFCPLRLSLYPLTNHLIQNLTAYLSL